MGTFPRCCRFWLPLTGLLLLPAVAQADGCVLGKFGKYVPEKEQRAFIEWEAGRERLFVATRIADTKGPALWLVPVPASPEQVLAEPVEQFPHVVTSFSEVEKAQEILKAKAAGTVFLNGLLPPFLCCPFALGTTANKTFSSISETVEVHQHIEKLGMIVEVLTAQSTDALDKYLSEKALGVKASQITALEPYLRKNFSLICAWPSQPGQPLSARAVRLEFPAPRVFYPLQPSRVYDEEIQTAIYVRGWWQIQQRRNLPGLHCGYKMGRVTEISIEQLGKPMAALLSNTEKSVEEPLTRVELSGLPQGWTDDLELVEGTPPAISLAQAIGSKGPVEGMIASSILGVVLAWLLPWAVVPREQRRWTDWLWALGVGGSICLSIYISALVFYFWCLERSDSDPWLKRTYF